MSYIDSSVYSLDSDVEKMAWFGDNCQLGTAVPWSMQYCSPAAACDYNVTPCWPAFGTIDYYYAKDAEVTGSCDSGLGNFVGTDFRQDNSDSCNYTRLESLTSQSTSVSLPWLHSSVTSNYCSQQQNVQDMADAGTDYWVDHCNNYVSTSDMDLSVPAPTPATVATVADDYLGRQQQSYSELPADACQLVTSSDCLQPPADSAEVHSSSQCQQGKLNY